MVNKTITNVDLGNVILKDAEFRDYLLTFAGAGTVAAGTILARDTTTDKLVPYVKVFPPVADANFARFVLTYDVTAAGAGDEAVRVGVAGEYRKERLVIDADGDSSNVDNDVIDQLRDYGLVPLDVQELNILDNQ